MHHRANGRLYSADSRSLRCDEDKLASDQWAINVVLTLEDEGWLQGLDAAVIAMIDRGASVFDRSMIIVIIDDMPVDHWLTNV